MLKLRAEFTDMLVFGQKLLNLRQGALAVTDIISASLLINLLQGYIGSSKEE